VRESPGVSEEVECREGQLHGAGSTAPIGTSIQHRDESEW